MATVILTAPMLTFVIVVQYEESSKLFAPTDSIENVIGNRFDITEPFTVTLTGYIDAITNETAGAENRRPPLTDFHVNQYQQNTGIGGGFLNGGPSNGDDDLDRSNLTDVNGDPIVHSTIDDNNIGLPENADTATSNALMRFALLSGAFVAVFIAAVSWLYYVIAIALWVLVFGDDSTRSGYYALAAAIPLALLLSAGFVGAAVRWSLSPMTLTAVIAVAVVLELLFVVAIRS